MRNMYKRLLTFSIGCTALVMFVVYGSKYQFIFNAIVLLASILGAIELRDFFNTAHGWKRPSVVTSAILGSACPLTAMLYIWRTIPEYFPLLLPSLVIIATIVPYVLVRKESDITSVMYNVTGRLFMILYPGFFSMYITLLGTLGNTRIILATYLLCIYLNDGAAYLTGRLFGNKKTSPIRVSPSKTIAGFLGGLFATCVVITSSAYIYPTVFSDASMLTTIFFALLIGIAAIVGDLFASALKRSAGIKQSGTVIPGRGGMLDSMDSIIFAAPVFYYAFIFLL